MASDDLGDHRHLDGLCGHGIPLLRSRHGKAANHKSTGKGKSKPVRSPDELLAEARSVSAEWTEEQLTAEAIRKTVRTSQASARTLRDALKAERAEAARFRPESESEAA